MFNKVTNIIIAIMLLTFVGQSTMSIAMACDMHMSAAVNLQTMERADMIHDEMDHSKMDHSTMRHDMHHGSMEAEDNTDSGCESDCVCPASGCTPTTVVTKEQIVITPPFATSSIIQPQIEQTKSNSNFLYRPPILA